MPHAVVIANTHPPDMCEDALPPPSQCSKATSRHHVVLVVAATLDEMRAILSGEAKISVQIERNP